MGRVLPEEGAVTSDVGGDAERAIILTAFDDDTLSLNSIIITIITNTGTECYADYGLKERPFSPLLMCKCGSNNCQCTIKQLL